MRVTMAAENLSRTVDLWLTGRARRRDVLASGLRFAAALLDGGYSVVEIDAVAAGLERESAERAVGAWS